MKHFFQIIITGIIASFIISACEPYETPDMFRAEFNTRVIETTTIINGVLTSSVVVDQDGCFIATVYQDDNPFLEIGPLCPGDKGDKGDKGDPGEKGNSIISEIIPIVEDGDTVANRLTIYTDVEPLGVVNSGDIPQSVCLIKNGTDGEDGNDGNDGNDGEDGQDGTTTVTILAPELCFTPLGDGCFNHFWWYDLDGNGRYTDESEYITDYDICVDYPMPETYALFFPFTHGDTEDYEQEGFDFWQTKVDEGSICIEPGKSKGYVMSQPLPETDQAYEFAFTHGGKNDHSIDVYVYTEEKGWEFIETVTGEGNADFDEHDADDYSYHETVIPEGLGHVKRVKLYLYDLGSALKGTSCYEGGNVHAGYWLVKLEGE